MGGGIAFELFTDWLAPPPRVEELYTYTPRTFPAIAVPSTRLFIFANAVSRAACARIAASNSGGRGMLPMGSVGIGMIQDSFGLS